MIHGLGERSPSIESLMALTNLYHCSTDYLLGLIFCSFYSDITTSACSSVDLRCAITIVVRFSINRSKASFTNCSA